MDSFDYVNDPIAADPVRVPAGLLVLAGRLVDGMGMSVTTAADAVAAQGDSPKTGIRPGGDVVVLPVSDTGRVCRSAPGAPRVDKSRAGHTLPPRLGWAAGVGG